MILGKFSFGVGDRFCRQGKAQLTALLRAKEQVVDITPVWNKSYREHAIIGTRPSDTRKEADDAVAACGWDGPYFVDADHIELNNVDGFIESSDFFTLDVADFIGRRADDSDINKFIKKCEKYTGSLLIDGIDEKIDITEEQIKVIADKFLLAVKQAGKIYRHIETSKGADNFITEVSMDEADQPQTPVEMLFILAAIADEAITAQTIAPRFTGRFNKGVDFVGDVNSFAREFEQNIAIIKFAAKEFNLPADLKLSVHSGSDKFSIYRPMREALKKYDMGLHIKTAGTTWLEELIGLAMAGGDELSIVKEVYAEALARIDELCGPYSTVIDISRQKLPEPQEVAKWDGEQFASALRHNQSCEQYNPSFRQLLHVAYKIAAEKGTRYLDALERYDDIIAQNVTENLYERHIRPIFLED